MWTMARNNLEPKEHRTNAITNAMPSSPRNAWLLLELGGLYEGREIVEYILDTIAATTN